MFSIVCRLVYGIWGSYQSFCDIVLVSTLCHFIIATSPCKEFDEIYHVTGLFTLPPPRPSVAQMRQIIKAVLFQIMARRLFGPKPLSKPMMCYCQIEPLGINSMKIWSKYKTSHSRKSTWKYRLRNGDHLVQGRWSDSLSTVWCQGIAYTMHHIWSAPQGIKRNKYWIDIHPSSYDKGQHIMMYLKHALKWTHLLTPSQQQFLQIQ